MALICCRAIARLTRPKVFHLETKDRRGISNHDRMIKILKRHDSDRDRGGDIIAHMFYPTSVKPKSRSNFTHFDVKIKDFFDFR